MKPLENTVPLRPDLLSIPWTAIRSLKFKNSEVPSTEGPSIRLKIKTKTYRVYNLMFIEKEQLVLNSIIKNFNSCLDYFTKFYFCFDLFTRLKHLEGEFGGWKIYDLKGDFKVQGLDLKDPDVG
jgi:hypothetical protein